MYIFSLEPLLNHVKFEEENLQKELGMLERQLFTDMAKLLDLKNKTVEIKVELEEKQKGGLIASMNILYHNFAKRLSEEIINQKKIIADSEKKVEEKRTFLLETVKKRKILDKLKEKGLREYMNDLLHKEQNFIDEIATSSFCRKKIIKNE